MFAEPQQKNVSQLQSPQSQSPHIQAKLEVGAKDDPQEKEADAVADSVMRMSESSGAAGDATGVKAQQESPMARLLRRHPDAPRPQIIHRLADAPKAQPVQRAPAAIQGPASPALRKKEGEENAIAKAPEHGAVLRMHDADEETVQKKEDEESVMKMDDEEGLQKKDEEESVMKMDDGGKGGTAPAAVEQGIQSGKGQGNPLPENVQQDIGGKMGADLSDVRVHTGSNAHEMSTAINAKAFTHGQDVYFKNGNYDTSSSSGKKLLTHELTHTQQQKAPGVQRKVQRGFWGDVWEGVKSVGNFVYENTGLKTIVETGKDIYHWAVDSPEEFQAYMQGKLKDKIDEIRAQKEPTVMFTAKYWAMKTIAIAMNPLSIFAMPSTQAIWDIFRQAKLGYYEHLYNLGNEYVLKKNEDTGKMERVKNESFKKGGYAEVFSNQMRNMLDPRFMLGEVVGIFKGIGGWFVDLWEMIKWFGEMIWGGIKGTWNLLVNFEPPAFMTQAADLATSAGAWFKENGKAIMEELGMLLQNPTKLKEVLADLRAAIKTGAEGLAYGAGQGMAALQVKIMSMSAYDQGEMVGKAIGYLIPEIIIAVFSGTIVNWIKGGVKALQVFGSALKGLKAIKALMNGARGVMNAFEKMGRLFKALGSKIGGALGKAFDNVMDFFKGILKWGDEAPAGAVDDVHAPHDRTPDGPDGPRNDGPDGPKNKPDADNAMRNLAYGEMVAEVIQSNAADEPIAKFKSDIYKIKRHFPIVKAFKFVPDGAGGLYVYMKASPWRLGGHKKAPKYSPTSKHQKGGWGTEMDLDDITAQHVLDNSTVLGKQSYGYHNGKIYEFQYDNVGGWHGYPIPSIQLISKSGGTKILRQWLKDGILSKPDYNKLIGG